MHDSDAYGPSRVWRASAPMLAVSFHPISTACILYSFLGLRYSTVIECPGPIISTSAVSIAPRHATDATERKLMTFPSAPLHANAWSSVFKLCLFVQR